MGGCGMSESKASRQCMVKACNGIPIVRGLCHQCYTRALRLVNMHKTTWAELERMGLARAPRTRAKKAAFDVAFEAARESAG